MQAQERGEVILCRGRDLRGGQYGCSKLQADSDDREQVTETRLLSAHFRRPRPHWVNHTGQFEMPQLNLFSR